MLAAHSDVGIDDVASCFFIERAPRSPCGQTQEFFGRDRPVLAAHRIFYGRDRPVLAADDV